LTTESETRSYDSGIGVSNIDNSSKLSLFRALIAEGSVEKVVSLLNFSMPQSDSMHIGIFDADDTRLFNGGVAKSYDLSLT